MMKEYGAEREIYPYWKVQYYEPGSCAWKDIQFKNHDKGEASAEARRLKAKKGRVRLMQVESATSRFPLPEL